MDGSSAIRAFSLQKLAAYREKLAAYRAIFPANGIGRLTVGKKKTNLLDEILLVRRTVGIRAIRSIALLEHRKCRLLAANLGRKLPLGHPRLAASQLNAFAEHWTKVFQGGDIMNFILSTIKGVNINIINNNINNVYNCVDIVD